jgi:hypothetical protein
MKNQIDAFEEGDLKPADVAKIAKTSASPRMR